MPISFLIPGYVQVIFGPGLETGRIFAITLGGILLFGFWFLTRRLGGRWWAAAGVWIFIWNPAIVKTYSLALTQGLVACMLVWSLVLVLGENRPLWQICLGGFLAGLMVLTRINMLPFLPLLVLYVFWQHGKKAGIAAILTSGSILIIGQLPFLPEIIRVWAYWLPNEISPVLDAWRLPGNLNRRWDPELSTQIRLNNFLQSVRFHLIFIAGVIVAWSLWPPKNKWKSRSDFRIAVFLSSIFISLLLAHMWATMGLNYCPYCLSAYMGFFSVIGLLLIILSFSSLRTQLPWWHQLLIIGILLAVSASVGYSAFEDISTQLLEIRIPGIFIGLSTDPSDFISLRKFLTQRYELENSLQRRLPPAILGLGFGILILFIAWMVKIVLSFLKKRYPNFIHNSPSFGYWALIVFLAAAILLTPTTALGGGRFAYDCGGNTIRSYQIAGDHLASLIPPGSTVYWRGGLSAAPLLYVPGIKIYPPQMIGDYSYVTGGEPDQLFEFGFWNQELDHRWINEADYILIEERFFKGWLMEAVASGNFDELEPSPPTVTCYNGSQIHIFKNIK